VHQEIRMKLTGHSSVSLRGTTWETHGRLQGAPPASAGPRKIIQAYCQQAEGCFGGLGALWKAGQRRLALSGGQGTAPPARCERLPRA
jgi:hypothetical protein